MRRALTTFFVFLLLSLLGSAVVAQSERVLYLTFDDGPNTVYENGNAGQTVELLDTLERYGVRATFFLPGENVNSWESGLLARMINNGHAIGIHSYHHGGSFESTGVSDQELAEQYIRAYQRVVDQLTPYPEAQETFEAQPHLYRRPGGSAHLMYFLNPGYNQSLQLSRFGRMLVDSTYDYSGWSLSSGDSVPPVYHQVYFGLPEEALDQSGQALVSEAIWEFLWTATLPDGTKTNLPGLLGLQGTAEESAGIVILSHDTFLSVVRSWEVILPRLITEGYSFDTLPRPIDRPNTFILGMG